MKIQLVRFVIWMTVVLIPLSSVAETDEELIKGVWKLIGVRNLTNATSEDPGNTHYMITSEYIMVIGGKDERPIVDKNFSEMTYDEIKSQLPAGGGFQRYKVIDGKIHRTTVFAMSEYFEGKLIITEFEASEERLVLRDDHYADGHLREWVMSRIE